MAGSVQNSNESEFERGNSYLTDLKSELASTRNNDESKTKRTKLTVVIDKMNIIDKACIEAYVEINLLKISLLNSNDNASLVKEIDRGSGMNLMQIPFQGLKEPNTETSLKDIPSIQKSLKVLNNELCQAVGTYNFRSYSFILNKLKAVKFKDEAELSKKISAQLDAQSQFNRDDEEIIEVLFTRLSIASQNLSESNPATLIGCLAVLTNVQNQILSVRSMALGHWRSKTSASSYRFDKIRHIIDGPSAIKAGQDIELTLAMMAYDSSNPPLVTVHDNPNVRISDNGDGGIKISLIRPKAGSHTISGIISIKNKSGTLNSREWEKTIEVIQ
jgi:hypothetical protein